MATYFVEINAHFLVKIEYDGSCGGAEHHFLDKYNWVWAANAYDEKGMKTDCFRAALLYSEIVSENELAARLQEICDADLTHDKYVAEYEAAQKEVTRLEKELGAAKEHAENAHCNAMIAKDNFEDLVKQNHANPRFKA